VFTRWTARGTHRGIFMGIPPTNNRGEVRGITIDRVADGKIIEHHESYDSLLFLQIMGAVPPLDRLMKGQVQQAARPQA
jgi:predicted ester cyclase